MGRPILLQSYEKYLMSQHLRSAYFSHIGVYHLQKIIIFAYHGFFAFCNPKTTTTTQNFITIK